MVTSSTAKPTRLARWMVTFEDGCAVCCNGGGMDGAKGSERPIIAGPTNGLPTVGCCPWRQNTSGRAQSYNYETTDRRAGCGRSASPVRREGVKSWFKFVRVSGVFRMCDLWGWLRRFAAERRRVREPERSREAAQPRWPSKPVLIRLPRSEERRVGK